MFLAFGYLIYYPKGGWQDMIGQYETVDDAIEACRVFSEEHDHEEHSLEIVHNGKLMGYVFMRPVKHRIQAGERETLLERMRSGVNRTSLSFNADSVPG